MLWIHAQISRAFDGNATDSGDYCASDAHFQSIFACISHTQSIGWDMWLWMSRAHFTCAPSSAAIAVIDLNWCVNWTVESPSSIAVTGDWRIGNEHSSIDLFAIRAGRYEGPSIISISMALIGIFARTECAGHRVDEILSAPFIGEQPYILSLLKLFCLWKLNLLQYLT